MGSAAARRRPSERTARTMATGASSALRTARASAPAGVDILQTLELAHPRWPSSYYLTNDPEPFTATLETGPTVTFLPYPFAVVLPSVDGAGRQDLQVTLTNADPLVRQLVELAHADPTTRIVAVYREFLSNAVGAPQSPPLRLSFDTIQINDEAVTGIANRSDVLNRRFPGLWYDIAHYPGLDR
jgi:hypothetical protein